MKEEIKFTEEQVAHHFEELLNEFEQKKDFICVEESLNRNFYKHLDFEKLKSECIKLKIYFEINKEKNTIAIYNRNHYK